MSTTKITERNLDEKFLQNLYTKDNPPTASNVGAVAESDLATAIQSLIDSGGIEVGGFRSPIKMQQSHQLSAGQSASGTGKGVLFLNYNVSAPSLTLIIDGNTLLSNSNIYMDSGYIAIEFTKSFNITRASNGNGYVQYHAVFY